MNPIRFPALLVLSACFLGLNLSTVHAAISIGKAVRCTENGVNVRNNPGTSASVVGTQNRGAQGVVVDNSRFASGYTWWKVNFSSGADGWVASTYLAEVTTAVVATPFINPGSMSTLNPVSVTMSTTTSGATIRYTINGSDPTANSTIYSGAFTLNSSATVKARAFKSGMADSAVATASYSISTPSVTTLSNNVPVSNLSGTQGSARTYRISVPAGQAKLEIKSYGGSGDADLYVRRGSLPTTSSYDFSGQNGGNTETITINNPASGDWFIMVRAYTSYSGLTLGAAYSAPMAVVATPFINPGSMSTLNPVSVTMSTTTSGATIRYTINGSDPTANSPIYSGAFTLNNSATVKARAFKSGMADSAVATASYSISTPSVNILSNNVPVSNLSGTQGSERTYRINVPAGQAKLEIKSYGGSGDADLYVRRGSMPTTSSYDFRPFLGGNTETVTVNSPAPGDWFVMIRGYTAYSGLTLAATIEESLIISQALANAAVNLGKTSGSCTWNGGTSSGIWADSQWTYCARFVRMCFGEPSRFSYAIDMYNAMKGLNIVSTGTNPPRGAVVFYGAHTENWNVGHVGISDGSGNQYSVTSRTYGVSLKPVTGTFQATYLGYITAEQFVQHH